MKHRFSFSNYPRHYLEDIPCPLCSSTEATVIYPRFLPRLNRCNSCGLIYTNPRLKKSYVKLLYNKDYFKNENSSLIGYQNYSGDEEKIRQTFKRRLTKIEKWLPQKGRLLDIGCATGFFMDTARNNGWEVNGIEISKFAANYATKKLSLDVQIGDFEQIAQPDNQYNLVTAWDVVEHLANPLTSFKRIHSSIKKDGWFVFSTPDVESIPARITKSNWVGYKLSDEHLVYFSPKTIKRLCALTGFEIKRIEHVGKYVSFPFFIDRVSLYSRNFARFLKLINRFILSNYSFFINPFDVMCVYARKK